MPRSGATAAIVDEEFALKAYAALTTSAARGAVRVVPE